jgi:hypothetical protein
MTIEEMRTIDAVKTWKELEEQESYENSQRHPS